MKKFSYIHVMVIACVCLVVGALIAYVVINPQKAPAPTGRQVTNFEECVAAGNAVMESYPRQCRSGGKTYVEEVSTRPADCVVAGCSGTVCAEFGVDDDIVTTCEYRSEYACYKLTACERQANGRCGWTPAPAFSTCLSNPPVLE